MINKTRASDLQPFSGLTPEVVLDAAAAFGLAPDGRLFALNSYENRVYQLGAGDAQLVLKFYRPARWSDAQIAEEHEFTAELAAAELPVAAPLIIGGQTLFRYEDFRFAAFPWMRGRAPELDAPEARPMLGRSLARIHQIGAARAFRRAATHRRRAPGMGGARAGAGRVALLPDALRERYAHGERGAAGARRARPLRPPPARATSASTATAIWAICCGTSTGRCSSTWMTAPWGRACRTCG